LEGQLHHVNISGEGNVETYRALSYAWEYTGGTETVYIDGRIYSIRAALRDALLTFRQANEPVFLFVDAICINMRDHAEHSTQVRMLKSIFQGAEEVSIWLGEAQEDAPATFNFLEQLNTTSNLDDFLRTDEATTALFGAGSLLSRRWFTRAWTVQELVVARQATFHVGPHSIRWEVFQKAIEILDSRRTRFPQTINHDLDYDQIDKTTQVLRLLKRSFERDQHGRPTKALLSLETLVTNLSNLRPTDPRDLIYAFLGIASDVIISGSSEIDALVTPDYSKSARQVYLDFVRFCIERSRSLDILFRPWLPENLTGDLPHWIWTANTTSFGTSASALGIVPPAGRRSLYSAAGPKSEAVTKFGADGTVEVMGFHLMPIDSLAPVANGEKFPVAWLHFSKLARFDLYRILLGNRDDDGIEFTDESYRHYFDVRRLEHDSDLTLPEDGLKRSNLLAHTRQRLVSLTYNRRLAFCADGEEQLALVPAESRKGDRE
jgi:hypothetical protein